VKNYQIAIADDHPIVRLGVRTILSENPQFKVSVEYEDAKSLLGDYAQANWDVLVLDIDLRDGNGVDLTKQMLAQRPELKILILSIYPEEKYALRAMRAGAKGYVNKDALLDILNKAVMDVAMGKLFVSEPLAQTLAQHALNGGGDELPHDKLSDRELQVLCLYGDGKGNNEIAAHLHVSVKTISTYRSRIMDKMQLHSTAELISYAIRHELVR